MSGKEKKPKIKITVRSLPKAQKQDPDWAQRTWRILADAINEIHRKNASHLSFEELYRNSYNMVLYKYADLLYRNVTEIIRSRLEELARPVETAHDEQFLDELNKAWSEHKLSMNCIRDILLYMDRSWVGTTGNLPVYDLGLRLFLQVVVQHGKVRPRLGRLLLTNIQRERSGEMINRGVMKAMMQMLIDLGLNSRSVYESEFEAAFLKQSVAFYRAESQAYIAVNTISDYMRKVEQRMKEEQERVQVYLDPQTEPKIRETLDKELISAHAQTMVDTGLVFMLQDDALADLNLMYRLLSRVQGGLDMVRLCVGNYVEGVGKELVTADTAEKKSKDTFNEFVQALLLLKNRSDIFVTECFNSDKAFQKSVARAFEQFVNLNERTPQYLSLFVDEQLTKGLKGRTDEEVDKILNSVIAIFRFLADKDVFEKYYKQHLSKRLLSSTSVSEDSERLMIAKLKMECGFQFTSKLEGMFQDVATNAQTNQDFQNWLNVNTQHELPLTLEVNVLTTTYWPIPRSTLEGTARMLPVLTKCTEIFTKFYLSKHDGRKLTFQPGLGDMEVSATVGKTRRKITCSVYQAIILVLFTEPESITYKDLLQQTGISDADMRRHLLSLTSSAKSEFRVLCKTGDKRTLEPTDVLTVNGAWKPKLKHVKIGLMGASKQREKEHEETSKKVLEERKINIDATVVRIMKSRKQMDHKSLVNETIQALSARFQPKPQLVKKQIESLISREYLERIEGESASYRYLA